MAIRCYMPSFDYAVTRPYPYGWFPWVVLIGGIFSLVLFSTINLAANGYELKVQYTTDPNSTVSQAQWAQQWPFSWFSKVETTCQSQTLQITSQFFTDKLSLPYTLTGVWQNQTAVPSLRYTNNVLENCTVTRIFISLDPSPSGWNTDAKAYIGCSINNDEVPTSFNLTTTYFANIFEITDQPLFLDPDQEIKASLWWGELLLDDVSLSFRAALLNTTNSNTEILAKGIFDAYFSSDSYSEKKPISSPSFFDGSVLTTCVGNPSSVLSGEYNCSATDIDRLDRWPTIFPRADRYAKILYSTILADLGISSSDNILTNASLIKEYVQYFNEWTKELNISGPLEITPSKIYAEYFCQVPHRKPFGPLIVAIVIADLVFLQAIYKILTWTTTAWTERNNPQAKFCEGCLANMERGPYELSLAIPKDAAQESLLISSETRGRLAIRSILERRKSSESRQSLVISPDLSE